MVIVPIIGYFVVTSSKKINIELPTMPQVELARSGIEKRTAADLIAGDIEKAVRNILEREAPQLLAKKQLISVTLGTSEIDPQIHYGEKIVSVKIPACREWNSILERSLRPPEVIVKKKRTTKKQT